MMSIDNYSTVSRTVVNRRLPRSFKQSLTVSRGFLVVSVPVTRHAFLCFWRGCCIAHFMRVEGSTLVRGSVLSSYVPRTLCTHTLPRQRFRKDQPSPTTSHQLESASISSTQMSPRERYMYKVNAYSTRLLRKFPA